MLRIPKTSGLIFDKDQMLNAIMPERHTDGLVDTRDLQEISLSGVSKQSQDLQPEDFEKISLS